MPWDVAEASRESWEVGVAAFALNARLRIPDVLRHWDGHALKARPDITGRRYRFDQGGARADWVAFLLERVIKPQAPMDRDYAIAELSLRLRSGERYVGIGHPAMWRAIWEESDSEELRKVALFFLSASGDPSALSIIAEVLDGIEDPEAAKRKARCLSGLVYNESTRAKDLVLEAWEQLAATSWSKEAAIGVLSTSPNLRARELLYSVALDRKESVMMRHGTVAKLSNLPHPTDRAFVRKFLTEVESDELKRKVVTDLPEWFPLEWYRPTLREIVQDSSDQRAVLSAAAALVRGHGARTPLIGRDGGWAHGRPRKVADLDIRAWEEDVALLEEAATRGSATDDTRFQIERCLAGMQELRRNFEQPPTDK